MSSFFSQKYDDIYFNNDSPEAEKNYVFLEANRVPERIKSAETFTVAELGFGFGVNFALTLATARRLDVSHNLRYFSVEESFPEIELIKQLGSKLGICREEYERFWLSASPPAPHQSETEDGHHNVATRFGSLPSERGVKTYAFNLDKTHLSPPSPHGGEGGRGGEARIYNGDVLSFLSQADFAADAWYFDGFSPAKNPAMWSAEVFAQAFALTKPGGTFSTYSSAGWVKRNLEQAGFQVEKVQGFGTKREMLTGFRK